MESIVFEKCEELLDEDPILKPKVGFDPFKIILISEAIELKTIFTNDSKTKTRILLRRHDARNRSKSGYVVLNIFLEHILG